MQRTNNIFIQSLNGMAYGYFISFVLGTLLVMVSSFIQVDFLSTIGNVMISLMGVAIAIGIGVSLKVQGIDMLCLIVSGGIASYFSSYLIVIYAIILLSLELIRLFNTSLDIWLKPLIVVIVSSLLAYFINPYIDSFMINLGSYFNTQMHSDSLFIKVIMSVIIAIVMGLFMPIGGTTICTLMNLNSAVCGIALSGICSCTIGLAVMGWKDKHIGDTLALLIGTPLLAFSNIIRRPIILIPLFLSCGISGILSGCVFLIEAPASASYGLMAFQGIMDTMAYNSSVYISAILLINIVVPMIICLLISPLLYRLRFIRRGDLKIEHL